MILTTLVVAPLGVACAERGAASPQAAAAAYLSAVRSGDVSALEALAPDGFDAREAAQTKIAAYAAVSGVRIETVFVPNDITPYELGLEFVAHEVGFKDSVRVQQAGSRWFVVIGRSRSTSPPFPTAQASR